MGRCFINSVVYTNGCLSVVSTTENVCSENCKRWKADGEDRWGVGRWGLFALVLRRGKRHVHTISFKKQISEIPWSPMTFCLHAPNSWP